MLRPVVGYSCRYAAKATIAYAAHMQHLLKPGIKTLLVAFDYSQHEMQGPPFSVQAPEIRALYSNWCNVELLCTEDILDREPGFRDKGVSRMQEQVYALTARRLG